MHVDAHQHFWSLARADYGWLTPALGSIHRDFAPADLEPILKRHGIARTVLVQAAPTIEETEYMLGIADATSWVGAVVGWIDFADPGHRRHLKRWAGHRKFRGVRPMIQDLTDERWALRPEHDWAFRALCDLDLHFEFLGLPRHAAVAGELLQRHPGLRCVLDHGLKPAIRERAFEPWASDMARLAGDSGALCKISGLVTEARAGWTLADLKPYVDHIVACFGPERVMWGSDWPVVNRNGGYDSWRAVSQALIGAHAGAHEILGEAAARFYRLSDQAS